MRSFHASTFDRQTAIAMARSPRWDDYFSCELLERSEELVGIAQPVGQLFRALGELCGPSSLADLFGATVDGSDVRLVGPIFNFWAMSELIPPPPKDFDVLHHLHRAAMALALREVLDGVDGMSRAQLDATAPMRARSRQFGGLMHILRADLERNWSAVARRLSEKFARSFPPARWTALACLGSVVHRPACTACCMAQLDPSLRRVMLKRTLELLGDCPT